MMYPGKNLFTRSSGYIILLLLIIIGFSAWLSGAFTTNPPNTTTDNTTYVLVSPSPQKQAKNTLQFGTLQFEATSSVTNSPVFENNCSSTTTGSVNPLLFGTNVRIDPEGFFVKSPKIKQIITQIHVRFIRTGLQGGPGGTGLTDSEKTSLQFMKQQCIVPLILLPLQNSLETDKAIVASLNEIFGKDIVYYELSNEPDLHLFRYEDEASYTSIWNSTISQLKAIALNGKFGGPALSQKIPSYVAYFVHNAHPKPDFVSWHEYNCNISQSADTCITEVSTWKDHIDQTRLAITKNGDALLPIIISEWNYDANVCLHTPDARATSGFLHTYIQTVFKEMVQDGVFAATQFEATNFCQEITLIHNTLTASGEEFGALYTQLIGK